MKKLILSFVFIFAITVSLFLVSASAFEIVTTDIDIVLDKSGDAFVTEKWTVAYTDAENLFNRHFDIYSAENTLSLVQKYGEITDVKLNICKGGCLGYDINTVDNILIYEYAISLCK